MENVLQRERSHDGEGAEEVIRVEYWSNSVLVGEISCLTNDQERIKQMKKEHDPFFFFTLKGFLHV